MAQPAHLGRQEICASVAAAGIRGQGEPHLEFEKEFAQFLQKAPDVQRFAKLPEQFGFAIEYTDSAGNLRYYEPDFVVLTGDGIHYIVETKGLEDTNVANKDRAAQLWCENTTRLAGPPWAYLKV
jgi:type III restriction enzyme